MIVSVYDEELDRSIDKPFRGDAQQIELILRSSEINGHAVGFVNWYTANHASHSIGDPASELEIAFRYFGMYSEAENDQVVALADAIEAAQRFDANGTPEGGAVSFDKDY